MAVDSFEDGRTFGGVLPGRLSMLWSMAPYSNKLIVLSASPQLWGRGGEGGDKVGRGHVLESSKEVEMEDWAR